MARTELPNGVILPAEYSDDWYEDMTSNLSKLDDVIGSDSEKLNADGVDFLRMSSAALTDGGTGNFSDLNSSYKIKTGDLVLDSGRKLYQVVSVDSTNERFTVGNSLFKVTAESDLAPVAESGDYDDLDNKPDLNPYDQHIANTDIHVTTADKTKWNNGVTQSYVFRYSGTAITNNSTIAYSTIDNTDNIKSGDKILDVDGKLFEITAVDTTNQTVTVGTALIDLALDANVVHTSENETIDGNKTFSKYITSDGSSTGDEYSNNARTNLWLMGNRDTEDVSGVLFDTFRQNTAQGTGLHILGFGIKENSVRYEGCRFSWLWDNNLNGYTFDFKPTTQGTNQAVKHNLGTSTDKWSEVHATTYYYGSSDTEFSQKFITTDTAQSINGNKNFIDNIVVKKIVSNVSQLQINAKTNADSVAMIGGDSASEGGGIWIYGKNHTNKSNVTLQVYDTDNSAYHAVRLNMDGSFTPTVSNNGLGNSSYKWVSFNGINPGALSLPDLNNGVDISGYITVNGGNKESLYTPPANGWVSVRLSRTSGSFAVLLIQGGMASAGRDTTTESGVKTADAMLPVVGGVQVSINSALADGVVSAYFYPCQGNI